jgi:hypothetical protein
VDYSEDETANSDSDDGIPWTHFESDVTSKSENSNRALPELSVVVSACFLPHMKAFQVVDLHKVIAGFFKLLAVKGELEVTQTAPLFYA